jgi:hypothetical protein
LRTMAGWLSRQHSTRREGVARVVGKAPVRWRQKGDGGEWRLTARWVWAQVAD